MGGRVGGFVRGHAKGKMGNGWMDGWRFRLLLWGIGGGGMESGKGEGGDECVYI